MSAGLAENLLAVRDEAPAQRLQVDLLEAAGQAVREACAALAARGDERLNLLRDDQAVVAAELQSVSASNTEARWHSVRGSPAPHLLVHQVQHCRGSAVGHRQPQHERLAPADTARAARR